MIATGLLLAFLLTAAVTDLWRQKIYNWTTYPGILIGLGLNVVGAIVEMVREPDDRLRRLVGWIGLQESVAGLFACGLIMLICLAFFRIGGGDVKLVAMLGAFLGLEQGIEAVLWTFVFGGCVGLIVLVWRVGVIKLLVQSFRRVAAALRFGGWLPLTDEERSHLKSRLFLAPMAAAAVIVVRFSLLDLLP